jgi:hypothetical protein
MEKKYAIKRGGTVEAFHFVDPGTIANSPLEAVDKAVATDQLFLEMMGGPLFPAVNMVELEAMADYSLERSPIPVEDLEIHFFESLAGCFYERTNLGLDLEAYGARVAGECLTCGPLAFCICEPEQ